MKHLLCRLLLALYLFPTISFSQSGVESQIKRVEQGLLPAVLIKGDPAWSIADRMKFYKVAGLSIAVIRDFKIDWARAYGLKEVESNEPVTTDTLFQAGSISKSVKCHGRYEESRAREDFTRREHQQQTHLLETSLIRRSPERPFSHRWT